MVFDVELLNLILYCAQQLGVALGLGAETIMLVAYVSAVKDGVIDEHEAQFLRATRNVLWVSIVLMVVSGLAITALHFLAGQAATVFSPAYLFKSLLIVSVIALTALLHVLPETFAEGLLGGTWYALFLVHILAPVASWGSLLTLLIVWLVGFSLVWYVIIFSTRERGAGSKLAVKSSEALILEKSAPPAKEKSPRKPLFSFLSFLKKSPKQEAAAPVVALVPAASKAPQQFQTIKLDPVPRTPPIVVKEALTPIEVHVPIEPKMPPQQVKTDAAPKVVRTAQPVEKLPGSIATDTPFLPQVPPLMPIPTIPASLQMPGQAAPPAPVAGIPRAPGQPPVLQRPEELPPVTPQVPPEIKLGLNVMPKSPDQIK
jgi:hypothetical protein